MRETCGMPSHLCVLSMNPFVKIAMCACAASPIHPTVSALKQQVSVGINRLRFVYPLTKHYRVHTNRFDIGMLLLEGGKILLDVMVQEQLRTAEGHFPRAIATLDLTHLHIQAHRIET